MDLFEHHARMKSANHLPRRKLSAGQKLAWLRLIRSENVGPVTFRDLINHFGSAEHALDALPHLARSGGRGKTITLFKEDSAAQELERAEKIGASLVAIGEEGYPPWLTMVDVPPPLLYMMGRKELAQKPAIAIVGARNGSAAGQKLTDMLARDLGEAGFCVASGLARGIDTAAHKASLKSGTIAVIAGGIDIFYPYENRELQKAIARDGILMTERPPGLKPVAKDFPRRNRIISGVSAGLIVVEAAQRSGSLISARFAAEQNREVFAIPGHPLDPRAGGTNQLIKNGATLITSAQDAIDILSPQLGADLTAPLSVSDTFRTGDLSDASLTDFNERADFNDGAQQHSPTPRTAPFSAPAPKQSEQSERNLVIEALGPAPIDIDEIIRRTGLSAQATHIILLELDLAGKLERHGQQLVSLKT